MENKAEDTWRLVKEPSEVDKFVMEGDKTVCAVFESFSPEKTWQNAHILAGSKDLLNALEGMVSLFPDGVEDDGSGGIGFNESLKIKYRAAVAAIAKAKGEAK